MKNRIRQFKLMIGISVLLLMFSGDLFSQSILTLRKEVTLKGPHILLKDIAMISSEDPGAKKELENIFLGEVPLCGEEELITKFEVIRHLRKLKLDTKKITFIGARTTQVRGPSKKISHFQVEDMLREKLQTMWGDSIVVEDFELLGGDRSWIVPEKDLTQKIDFLNPKLGKKRLQCWFYIYDQRKPILREKLNLKVSLSGLFWVAKRDLERNQILTEKDFIQCRHEVKPTNKDLLDIDINEAVGRSINRRLKKGKYLNPNHLMEPFLIERGDMVKVFIQQSNMEISLEAKALNKGLKGDIINVLNPNSGKVISAEVLGRGLVGIGGRK